MYAHPLLYYYPDPALEGVMCLTIKPVVYNELCRALYLYDGLYAMHCFLRNLLTMLTKPCTVWPIHNTSSIISVCQQPGGIYLTIYSETGISNELSQSNW